MDQRRVIAFLMLSMAVVMFAHVLFPPPQQPPQQAAELDEAEPANADAIDALAEDDAPAPPALPPARMASGDGDDGGETQGEPRPVAAEDDASLTYATIGSIDPASGFRMLVTLSGRGAAIERVELASPRFRDLQDRQGYLGHVARADPDLPVADQPGAVVRIVGPGTPAALAGLKPGDRIVACRGDGEGEVFQIKSSHELQSTLRGFRPDDRVTLEIVRADGNTESVVAVLERRPLELIRPEIENLRMRNAEIPPGFESLGSFLTSLHALDGASRQAEEAIDDDPLLASSHWELVEQTDAAVAFRRVLATQGLEFTKRYTLAKVPEASREDPNYPAYDLQLDIQIRNIGEQERSLSYRIAGPNGLPIEGWWYANRISRRWFKAGGLRDVNVRFADEQVVQYTASMIADDKVEPMGHGASLAFAGVDSQYFAAVLIPEKQSLSNVWFDDTRAIWLAPEPDKRTPKTFTNVSFVCERQPIQLAGNRTHTDSFRVFLGPKRPALLAQYFAAGDRNYNLSSLIYYGWFGTIARAMLGVMHFFYGIVGNYGIAIILLTVLVRGCLFPLSLKQTQSMARMQELKPEIDKLTEKYKTDMQKRSQAMQELYRKHSINPLSGCLPMFIQLPILVGLYRALMVDVELRQSPLLSESIRWISNLAAPDMLYDWSWLMPSTVNNGIGLFGLGPYLNVLPLVTVTLFLVSQKMFMPPPTSDQAAIQQSVMKYMTLFMGLIFYKVASGLCLYFITSSLWGIGERKLLPRLSPASDADTPPGNSPGKTGTRPPRGRDGGDSSPRGGGGGGGGPGTSPRNGSPRSKKRQKAKRKK